MNGWASATLPTARAAAKARPRDGLAAIRRIYGVLVAGAAFIQILLFWSAPDNILSTGLALLAALCGIGYSLGAERFRTHPISACVLLLFTTTGPSGSLLVKTLEGTPLVDRLQVPLTTFAVLAVAQLALIAGDRLYLRARVFAATHRILTRRVLAPLGLFRWPTNDQLWMLGLLGCVSVLMTGTDFESDASFGLASAGTKIIRAFGFLKFAPFLIPFRGALSGVRSGNPVRILPLGMYFVMLVGISFATNSRSTFADAIPTVGLCALLAVGLGKVDFRRFPVGKAVLLGVGAILAASVLSRVALAMVVVRDFRQNADVGTLVRLTLEAMTNSEWLDIAKSKMDVSLGFGNYSETYVDSRFFGRFLLTKFHDNIIYYCSMMGPDQIVAYKSFLGDRIAGMVPEPLLRPFGITLNKEDLIVSNGDYIIYLVDGWGLGGFKTGSMIGELYGIYGFAFPLLLSAATLLLFVVYDAFATIGENGALVISPFVLVLIWNLCGTTAAFGLGAETVSAIITSLVRGLPQNLAVYALAVVGTRRMLMLAGRTV